MLDSAKGLFMSRIDWKFLKLTSGPLLDLFVVVRFLVCCLRLKSFYSSYLDLRYFKFPVSILKGFLFFI